MKLKNYGRNQKKRKEYIETPCGKLQSAAGGLGRKEVYYF